MKQKYYTVYKTTNSINGKFYIGVHKTSNPFDDYLGSGKYFKRAVEKYGIENFTKEILAIFETPEEAYQLEAELVTFELIESGICYNLTEGGIGKGFEYANINGLNMYGGNHLNLLRGNELIEKLKEKNQYEKWLTNQQQKIQKAKQKSMELYPNGTWKGRTHSDESKTKIGIANSKIQQGKGNSQYGTCWITKDGENKKIKKDDLESWLEQGWIKGRVILKTN